MFMFMWLLKHGPGKASSFSDHYQMKGKLP